MAVLGLGVPRRRSFRQPQFRPSSPGFPLLAGQPVPQGVDQVIVGELVVALRLGSWSADRRRNLRGRWA